jgi:hypothetical protein
MEICCQGGKKNWASIASEKGRMVDQFAFVILVNNKMPRFPVLCLALTHCVMRPVNN